MKIAIVGTGISGLAAAHLLRREHELTLFEAADYAGGHTHTHDIRLGGRSWAVDTGFIVFNHKTYPNFTNLLADLNVLSQPTEMSFSVKCVKSGLEYNGTNLDTLFAQRRNLVKPSFWRMIRDILRFNRDLKAWLAANPSDSDLTLGDYLSSSGYSSELIEHYIIPMGAAVWSAGAATGIPHSKYCARAAPHPPPELASLASKAVSDGKALSASTHWRPVNSL